MSKNTRLITLVVKLNKLNRPQKISRLAPMNKDDIKEAKMNQRQERQKDKKRQKNKNAKRLTDDKRETLDDKKINAAVVPVVLNLLAVSSRSFDLPNSIIH